jgi:peptide/nickel transport system permease protein
MMQTRIRIAKRIAVATGFLARYKRNRGAVFGLVFLSLLVSVAVLADAIAHDPFRIVADQFLPPSVAHPFGTDDWGRDGYSQVVYGSRISLVVGSLSVTTATIVGVLIGALSGFLGGKLDETLMRFTEAFMVIPGFILALVILAVFGSSLANVILAIGIVAWPSTARLVRSEFLTLKEREYVLAAKALGATNTRIIFSEILPNALPPIIVNASLQVGTAIIIESSLSFLGLSDPSVMTWGWMLGNAQLFLSRAWWMAVFPGLAILVTVLSLNLIGDGLNDALNPRLRKR